MYGRPQNSLFILAMTGLLKRLLRSVPVGDLDEQLTGLQLAKISRSLSEWQLKGAILGLAEEEIEDIREDHKNSNEMQKVAMLRRWAKINGPQATLRNLIEVSCQNGLETFARDVCVSLGYISKQNGNAICSKSSCSHLLIQFFSYNLQYRYMEAEISV